MKTLRIGAAVLFAAALQFTFSSCEKEENTDNTPPSDALENFEKLGTSTNSNDVEVSLYAQEAPFVGYNHLAVRLTDKTSGNNITSAGITYRPMMDMGMMKHTTPVQNPTYSSEIQAYSGWVTFIMPSTTSATWSFEVIVDYMGSIDTLSFAHEVVAPAEARLYSFISMADSSSAYFVALRQPMEPDLGMNDFELMIYQRETMMSFPPASNLKVEIEPEMPSMGHGSPNNVNPVHVEGGHYRGKVNFTMSGHWKVNMTIRNENDSLLHTGSAFNIIF